MWLICSVWKLSLACAVFAWHQSLSTDHLKQFSLLLPSLPHPPWHGNQHNRAQLPSFYAPPIAHPSHCMSAYILLDHLLSDHCRRRQWGRNLRSQGHANPCYAHKHGRHHLMLQTIVDVSTMGWLTPYAEDNGQCRVNAQIWRYAICFTANTSCVLNRRHLGIIECLFINFH